MFTVKRIDPEYKLAHPEYKGPSGMYAVVDQNGVVNHLRLRDVTIFDVYKWSDQAEARCKELNRE